MKRHSTSTNGIVKQSLRRRTLVTISIQQLPLKSDPNQLGKQFVLQATPVVFETMETAIQEAKQVAAQTITAFPNHLLFMFYPTRIADETETLANAAKFFGVEMIDKVNMPCKEQPILPGHCLLAFIDRCGNIANDNTFSLRPDLSQPVIYQMKTAMDNRLPLSITNGKTIVRPAVHTTFQHEIHTWAEAAFYTHYVQRNRPYRLHFLFKPVDGKEKSRYFSIVNEMKKQNTRYSLLDHLHPNTGDTSGQIVAGKNCTAMSEFIETDKMKKWLGDNPTPQLVKNIFTSYFFREQQENAEGVDVLERRYMRGA